MSTEKSIFEPEEGFASAPTTPSPFAAAPDQSNPFDSDSKSQSPFSKEGEASPKNEESKGDAYGPFSSGEGKSPFSYDPPASGLSSSPFEGSAPAKPATDSPFSVTEDPKPAAATESAFVASKPDSPDTSGASAEATVAAAVASFEKPVQAVAVPAPAATPAPATAAATTPAAATSAPATPAAGPPASAPATDDGGFDSDSKSIRQLELRAIFGVDRELTESEILQRSRALPGIRHLARVASTDAGAVDALKRVLAGLGFGGGQVKLYCGSAPIEFVREGKVLMAVQTDGGFAPGVRETLMLVARELGRM